MATEAQPREPAPPRDPSDPATPGATGRSARGRLLLVVAVLAGLVSLASAAALPFAPVRHDRPVVTWPQDAAAPESTSLLLVAHRPAALQVDTTCATARAAAATDDGLLFSTKLPEAPQASGEGVLWRVSGGELRLDVAGTELYSEPVPDGDCTLQVVTRGETLQLLWDGQPVGEPSAAMPEVDSLVTSLTTLDASAGQQLSAQVAVNDEFAGSPTALKLALVVLLVLSGLVGLACLALLDRAEHRPLEGRAPPSWRTTLRPRWWDALVVGAVVLWTFLAPMTDDDGYYAAMSRNIEHSGYVGQYYQLYDQSFTPLSWPWYLLGQWLQIADSPLWVRLPAMGLGLVTWLGVRRAVDLLLGDHERWGSAAGRVRGRVVGLLVLAFLTAWTPYVMGVRPEGISAAFSALVLVGVLTCLRSGRLLPLGVAVVLAAFACAAHPTGAVAVAPLLAAMPHLWRRLASAGRRLTVARVIAVVAPGATASAAGFSDGTLRDYQRGREVFKAIETPLTWTDEIRRYEFLFNANIPMGAYAKRTIVLLSLLAVLLGLLLVVAGRARRPVPQDRVVPIETVTITVLLAFVCLWVTPSKWTHHFGSLAGLAPLLLVVLLLIGPELARRAFAGRPVGAAVGVGVVAGVVVVAAISMDGPNLWPYSWQLGMPHPDVAPYLSIVRLGSPVWWVLGAVVVAVALRLLARRRTADGTTDGAGGRRSGGELGLRTAGITAVGLMVVSTGYLLGSFGIAAASTLDSYSPGASMLRDPLDEDCGAAGAITVGDDTRAVPLAADTSAAGSAETISPRGSFAQGEGWWRGDPPPGAVGEGALTDVWGSLGDGDQSTGSLTTGWFDLSGYPADQRSAALLAVLVAGDLDGTDTRLLADFGVREGEGVRTTTTRSIADGASSSEWRTVRLLGGAGDVASTDPVTDLPTATDDGDEATDPYDPALAAQADVVRIRAVDEATGNGGWLAVTSPSVLPTEMLQQRVPRDAVVATSWQLTYLFPCQEQVSTGHGISDRPDYAVLVGGRVLEGIGDSVWQPGRGGLYAQVPEAATLTQLSSAFTDTPDVTWGQLARIDWPYAADAYDVRLEPEVALGTQGPTAPALG